MLVNGYGPGCAGRALARGGNDLREPRVDQKSLGTGRSAVLILQSFPLARGAEDASPFDARAASPSNPIDATHSAGQASATRRRELNPIPFT